MEEVLEYINNSRITLIGYSYKYENIKDEIISKLQCEEINSSFNIRQHIRNSSIDNILHNKSISKNLTIDVFNSFINEKPILERSKYIEDFFRKITSEIRDFDNHKIIITTPINKNINNDNSYVGGNVLLYCSDLVLSINSYDINVVKNRHGLNNLNIKI